MKKLILLLVVTVIIVGCKETENIVGEPEAEIKILKWSQDTTEINYKINGTVYTKKYEDIVIEYEIENTGDLLITEYDIWFGFTAYDSTVSPYHEYKDVFRQWFEDLDINKKRIDTTIFQSYERYLPVIEVECDINRLNFL